MRIAIAENLKALEVLRRAGYGQVNDRRASELSWSRRLGTGVYPRFHAYVKNNEINLHLDQKQASYEGYSAHSGEYDGEVVGAETDRINQVMNALAAERQSNIETESIGPKKGFFSRLIAIIFGD